MNIEIFSCSGGMAEGFRRAGVVFDWVFDKDPDACDSYQANLGHRPVQMDARDLLRMVRGGWRPGPIDLLVADPPCTPWSRAGKRLGTADERDMLGETCDLVELLRPHAYLIGNVPGLEDSTQWPNVQRALAPLHRAGYCIADFATLDAADYGVPQHRVRPFWYGHLGGPCIRWPSPTHGDPALVGHTLPFEGAALHRWMTCRDALGHLPAEQLGRPVRLRKRAQHSPQHGSIEDRPARVVGTSNLSDGNVLLVDGHPACEPDKPGRAQRADGGRAGRGESVLLVPEGGHPLAPIDGCAPTIRGGGGGHSAPQVILVNDRHAPSVPEAPAPTVGAKYRGQGSQVLALDNGDRPTRRRPFHNPHPMATPDAPAPSIVAGAVGGAGARTMVLDKPAKKRPPSTSGPQSSRRIDPDKSATTIDSRPARAGSGNATVAWPWDRPSTTVTTRDTVPPPGHHPESGSILSLPNAIVLSERAAAILQGFPESWHFAGATKRARWSQLGQAMPPPLAEAVARAIVDQQRHATCTDRPTDILLARRWRMRTSMQREARRAA